jgi:hypothetical protein
MAALSGRRRPLGPDIFSRTRREMAPAFFDDLDPFDAF